MACTISVNVKCFVRLRVPFFRAKTHIFKVCTEATFQTSEQTDRLDKGSYYEYIPYYPSAIDPLR